MEDKKKLLQKAKNIFKNLKTDPNSINRQWTHKKV